MPGHALACRRLWAHFTVRRTSLLGMLLIYIAILFYNDIGEDDDDDDNNEWRSFMYVWKCFDKVYIIDNVINTKHTSKRLVN